MGIAVAGRLRMSTGDPQTAVTHLGDVVLFVEATIARFNVRIRVFLSLVGTSLIHLS